MSYPPPPQNWGPPPSSYAYTPPRSGSGIAIAALVVSILALLGVLGIGAFAAAAVFSGFGDQPLTGTVSGYRSGPLTGQALADTVIDRMGQDGSVVGKIDCPDTAKVDQGVVTVCHASIDGGDWAVIVYFEDDQGTYTLDPI